MDKYFGVTGATSSDECEELLGVVPEKVDCPNLMLGLLVSYKTLLDEKIAKPNRYPPLDKLDEVFVDHHKAVNLVHYCPNPNHQEGLGDEMLEIEGWVFEGVDGFQLNTAWPDMNQLYNYREATKPGLIVLQISSRALEMVNNSTQQLVTKVDEYFQRGVIDHILIDKSAGEAKIIDPAEMMRYLQALHDNLDYLENGQNLTVAGGLRSSTVHTFRPILKRFPLISTDMEGGVRDTNDRLNLGEAKECLRKLYKFFS